MGWWLRKALRHKVPSMFSCVGCPSTHGACTIINCSSRSADLANRRDSQALINAYSMREFRAKVIAPTLSQLQPIHRERIDAKRRSMVQIAHDNSHNSLCYEMRLSFALTIGAAFERNLRLWLLFGLAEHRPVIERADRRSLFKLVADMKGPVAALKIESGDIIELWELVSTARHGDGPAAMRLSSLNPDLWSHQDASAQVEYSRAGLRAYTIRVNDSDLERYLDATIDFWESASRR
jgi:hypothetical protein